MTTEEIQDILINKYSLPDTLAKLLSSRIEKPSDASYFLYKGLTSLHSPFYFRIMDDCINRIRRAIDNREKILIFSDKDTDGLCSLGIMRDFFNKNNTSVICRTYGDDLSYGVREADIMEASADGVQLIIFLDLATNNKGEIDLAKSKVR